MRQFKTYRTVTARPYQFDLSGGHSPQSCGGVHLVQLMKTESGWNKRVVQSNGNHTFTAKGYPISDEEAESHLRAAGLPTT